jgi:hypothetical protein
MEVLVGVLKKKKIRCSFESFVEIGSVAFMLPSSAYFNFYPYFPHFVTDLGEIRY